MGTLFHLLLINNPNCIVLKQILALLFVDGPFMNWKSASFKLYSSCCYAIDYDLAPCVTVDPCFYISHQFLLTFFC